MLCMSYGVKTVLIYVLREKLYIVLLQKICILYRLQRRALCICRVLRKKRLINEVTFKIVNTCFKLETLQLWEACVDCNICR
jgi:hypothetical protein